MKFDNIINSYIAEDLTNSPLSQEALKYKSAEEFVKAQGTPVYRGGNDLSKEKNTDAGISISKGKNVAEDFVKQRGGKVDEFLISTNAKIIDYSDVPNVKFKNLNDYSSELDTGNKQIWRDLEVEYRKAVNWAKSNGYDGVKLPLEGETRIINIDVLKTKSQLIDIWNKAQTFNSKGGVTESRGIIVYRGIRDGEKRFAGEHYSTDKSFAEKFGKVTKHKIDTSNILDLTDINTVKDLFGSDIAESFKSGNFWQSIPDKEGFTSKPIDKVIDYTKENGFSGIKYVENFSRDIKPTNYLMISTPKQNESVNEQRNWKPMTHAEYSKKAKVSTPCTAYTMNYGGSCFNCGWDPAMNKESMFNRILKTMPKSISGYDPYTQFTTYDLADLAQHEIDLYNEGEHSDIKDVLSAFKVQKWVDKVKDLPPFKREDSNITENAIKGGKADKQTTKSIAKHHNVPVEDILKQLYIGIKVEMEHTNDRKIAREISLDHISEFKDYYTRLKKMETQAKSENKKTVKEMISTPTIGSSSYSGGIAPQDNIQYAKGDTRSPSLLFKDKKKKRKLVIQRRPKIGL